MAPQTNGGRQYGPIFFRQSIGHAFRKFIRAERITLDFLPQDRKIAKRVSSLRREISLGLGKHVFVRAENMALRTQPVHKLSHSPL
jgi:hypothetical protein